MRPYVSDFINTLSKQRQERVADVLEEARIGKEQLVTVAKRLEEEFGEFVPLVLGKEVEGRGIDAGGMSSNVRDIALRIRDLFDLSNVISLLLDSHAVILSSDIKAIEDELIALEKMAYNFSFLMADNQTYNYAHLEPFSDERGREIREVTPDRSGSFGATALASVRTDEGVLSLPDDLPGNLGLTAQIVASNATAYKVSDTGLANLLVRGTSTGWKMVVASPGPVTSSLTTGNPGAQAKIEFTLNQPAPLSEIKIVPFADMSVDVLQITVFSGDDNSTAVDLLDSKRTLDRPITFHFPIQSVARFHVLISQSTYNRVTLQEKAHEYRYKALIDNIKIERQNETQIRRDSLNIKKLERSIRVNRQHVSIPSTLLRSDRGPFDPVRFALARRLNRVELWRSNTDKSRLFHEVLSQADYNPTDEITYGQDHVYRSQDEWVPRVISDTNVAQVTETGYNYYYTLGLYSVSAGAHAPGFKGVFVSKPMPGSGDIGEVRLKASEENYNLPLTSRHSKQLTSVEYSVSNTSEPDREEDWVAIMPVGQVEVIAERLFPDASGACYLRFPASTVARITVYKEGYEMDIPFENYLYNKAHSQVIGVRINGTEFTASDVLTCDYTPIGDHNTISFAARGFGEVPLISAYDSDGAGEEFLATGDRNTVTLSNEPYVDAAISASSGYQPVVVRLNDGTVALNATDYATGKATAMPTSGYYYVHSGNTLMFNNPITQSFRVYYQYLQSNVRVRVVLRCNSKDFVSPKVDYFHLKAKIRKSDTTKL